MRHLFILFSDTYVSLVTLESLKSKANISPWRFCPLDSASIMPLSTFSPGPEKSLSATVGYLNSSQVSTLIFLLHSNMLNSHWFHKYSMPWCNKDPWLHFTECTRVHSGNITQAEMWAWFIWDKPTNLRSEHVNKYFWTQLFLCSHLQSQPTVLLGHWENQ